LVQRASYQKALQRALEQLTQWGLNTEEVSSVEVGLLTPHLGKGHETDLAIVFLLGRSTDPSVPELLTSLEKRVTDKEIRKEIRRSLYRLAQKGAVLPRPDETRGSVAQPIFSLGPEIEGYLSSVDGVGGRLVWLAKPQAGSGVQLLQGMVSDREGLVRVTDTLIRRKELRQMAREIKERHDVTMIPVPWEYADQILYQGFEKAKHTGRSGLEEFSSLRMLFSSAPPKPSPHPIYSRLDLDEIRSRAWREQSRRLSEESEFRHWLLDEDWLRPYLEQVEEAQGSRLVLNPLQKEERLAGIVRHAAREIFSGERGGLFQRRMEDMALYLLETRRAEQAQLALAVALAIGEGDLGGLGALDITFLTGIVQKSFAFYLSQAKSKAAEGPSLIVRP